MTGPWERSPRVDVVARNRHKTNRDLWHNVFVTCVPRYRVATMS